MKNDTNMINVDSFAPKLFGQQADVKNLSNAIASFNSTAHELEHSYKMLQGQVRDLNRELEEKNLLLESNLQEKERVKNFLSSILESLPTGVIVTDLNGNLLMSNSELMKITSFDPHCMQTQDIKEWLMSMQLCDFDDMQACPVKSFDVEININNADLRSLKVLRSPVVHNNGEIIGMLFVFQDQTRLKKLETQSERDQRLKAMGEMAITIAHEVRNPLGSIELFASILRSELNGHDDLQQLSERIINGVKSLDNSISNLLLFTRPQKPLLCSLDISDFLNEFIDFVGPIVNKNDVLISLADMPPVVSISADKDLLKQVFLNLTLNALQAMKDGGTISIKGQLYADESNPEMQWLEIEFSDTGSGIDPEKINKIFHPFYTTKDKGTGLGLAIVHNIIESHRGTIVVRSMPGNGTSFLFSLPVTLRADETLDAV